MCTSLITAELRTAANLQSTSSTVLYTSAYALSRFVLLRCPSIVAVNCQGPKKLLLSAVLGINSCFRALSERQQDPKKYGRAKELLVAQDVIAKAKKQIDVEKMAAKAAAK